MSTTDPNRPARERAGGGLPRASTPVVAVVVAAVAGLLGLLILKDVKDDGDGGGGGNGTTPKTTTTAAGGSTTSGAGTPTTQPLQRQGATVVVANSSGQDGVAGALSTALKNRGYTMGTPTNGTAQLSTTVIMVKAGDAQAAAVAQTLMLDMELTGATAALTTNPPIDAGTLGSATILVLLGTDEAGQALKPLGGATAPTTATTAKSSTATTDGAASDDSGG